MSERERVREIKRESQREKERERDRERDKEREREYQRKIVVGDSKTDKVGEKGKSGGRKKERNR